MKYTVSLLAAILFSFSAPGQNLPDSLWPPRFTSELRKPHSVTMPLGNTWAADFGKAAFGTVVITVNCEAPGNAVVRLGEKKTLTGEPDPHPGGSIRYAELTVPLKPGKVDYRISLPPDKRNTNPPAVPLPDSFGVVMPFRYCSITAENLIGEPLFRQLAFNYTFNDDAASFKSSDTVLNSIWDLCKYSVKATSFAGYYIDGDRERIPYEADAYINQLSHYAVDSEYTLAQRTNEYFISNPTWPTEWILQTVFLFYNDWLYTGNLEQIRRHYNSLKAKSLIALARTDGLISSASPVLTDSLMSALGFKNNRQRIRDIVDWPPAQKDTGWKLATPEGERDGYDMRPVNTVVNALHYMNLEVMARLARQLGHHGDAKMFSSRALTVKKSINTKLFDSARGVYVDGEGSTHASLHANMFALASGIVEKDRVAGVVDHIKTRGMACSVYGAQYLLDALYEAGEANYALSLMTATGDRSWYNMIRSGSTVTLEAWDLKYKPNLDWNHAWGAAPANIIVRRLWGLRPAGSGFSEAVIEPQPGKLKWSELKAPTVLGPVTCRFEASDDGTEHYTVDIPRGMRAAFIVSNGNRNIVRANGKKITYAERLELREGENTVIVAPKKRLKN